MKIAMLLNDAGRAISPEMDGTVYVYQRTGNDWVVTQTRVHTAATCTTIATMRAYLIGLCDWLGDCTVLAAQRPHGFGGLVFAQRGIDVWMIDGASDNYLDQIEQTYRRLNPAMTMIPTRPTVTAQ